LLNAQRLNDVWRTLPSRFRSHSDAPRPLAVADRGAKPSISPPRPPASRCH